MRRVAFGLVLSFLMLGSLLVPAGTVHATRPEPVDATLTITSAVVTSVRVADGNTILTILSTADLTGDLVGTLDYELRLVIHPTGRGNFHLSGTFTGIVDDSSGAFVLGAQGKADFSAGQQRGQWEVRSGTDGLASLHIQGTFEGPIGGPITLSGRMHFDP